MGLSKKWGEFIAIAGESYGQTTGCSIHIYNHSNYSRNHFEKYLAPCRRMVDFHSLVWPLRTLPHLDCWVWLARHWKPWLLPLSSQVGKQRWRIGHPQIDSLSLPKWSFFWEILDVLPFWPRARMTCGRNSIQQRRDAEKSFTFESSHFFATENTFFLSFSKSKCING